MQQNWQQPLLKQYGLDINHLYTHTHWLNVRDGRNGTIDQLNTMYNRYKMCPAYILPHWAEFKKKVQSYLNAGTHPLFLHLLQSSFTG